MSLNLIDQAALQLIDDSYSFEAKLDTAKKLRATQFTPCPGIQCKMESVDKEEPACPLCNVKADYLTCSRCEGAGWVYDMINDGTMCCPAKCENGRLPAPVIDVNELTNEALGRRWAKERGIEPRQSSLKGNYYWFNVHLGYVCTFADIPAGTKFQITESASYAALGESLRKVLTFADELRKMVTSG